MSNIRMHRAPNPFVSVEISVLLNSSLSIEARGLFAILQASYKTNLFTLHLFDAFAKELAQQAPDAYWELRENGLVLGELLA